MGRNKTIVIILCCCAFIGIGGLHDFYLKRWKWGIVKLLTLDFFLIGAIIDIFKIVKGDYPMLNEHEVSAEAKVVANQIAEQAITNNPKLQFATGSEKQIDWATRLASEFVKNANELIFSANESGDISEDEANEILDATQKEVLNQDDANWWIDNRSQSTIKILKMLNQDNESALNIIKKIRY